MGLIEFLRPAKNVPTTWWSADDPWTLKPSVSTLILLIIGLNIFGAGDEVLIAAGIGNTPPGPAAVTSGGPLNLTTEPAAL